MLGACSNDDLPKWFTGEPTQAEINAYNGPLKMPGELPENVPFPNLADVPPRPVPKVASADQKNEIAALEKDNAEGQAAVAAFVEESKPKPPVVKAKPVIEPKKKKKKKASKKSPKKTDDVLIPESGAAQ
jgi:hypothetical protein